MGTDEGRWEWRTRTVWISLAALYTILPCMSFVSGELGHWLGGPHTWGGRIAVWSIAAFFWILYIARMSRRNVALAVAIAVSLAELVLVLNRLNIIKDQTARATNLEMIGLVALAAFFWACHFRLRAELTPRR